MIFLGKTAPMFNQCLDSGMSHVLLFIAAAAASVIPAGAFAPNCKAFAPQPLAPASSRIELGAASLQRCEAPLLRKTSRPTLVVLRAEDEDSVGGKNVGGKDEILKKLAATDAPKGPEVKKTKQPGALPEWSYFVAPIVGAVVALAVQQITKAPLPFG